MAALPSFVARGNGRSYGDSSLNPSGVVATWRLAHILAFEADTGVIVCESGVMLCDIIDVLLPRGWFPPVTPGTRYVTVGGMIASDVHGKKPSRRGGPSAITCCGSTSPCRTDGCCAAPTTRTPTSSPRPAAAWG